MAFRIVILIWLLNPANYQHQLTVSVHDEDKSDVSSSLDFVVWKHMKAKILVWNQLETKLWNVATT